ncbi:MAG: hypothetical protein H6591_13430 [Flavobacteriales bacterium]|nr:hypothetical protein [Flavobacteriales bacterium]
MEIRNNLVTAAALLAPVLMSAQVSYLFSHDIAPQPYQNISGATAISTWAPDGWRSLHDLPSQEAWAFGSVYDVYDIAIHRDGVVRLTNDESTAYFHLAGTPLEETGGASGIGYQMVTTTHGATLVVQARDMHLANGLSGNTMNAQLWIALETGHVYLHFGPRSDDNASGFNNDSGPHIGLRKVLADGSGCIERVWVSGDPDSPQVSYDQLCDMPSLFGLPEPGTMYRYEPTFFTPNGIAEHAAPALAVSPSIADDHIQVRSDAGSALQATLRGSDGRLIQQLRIAPGMNTIDVSTLTSGVYLLTSEGHAAVRFVKG